MIIQLSLFSPFSVPSLWGSFFLFSSFLFFYFRGFVFTGYFVFFPLHFQRDEWFGLARFLGSCDAKKWGVGIVRWMDAAAAGWVGFVWWVCSTGRHLCCTIWYVPAREKEGGRGCAPFPQVFIYLSHGPFAVCIYIRMYIVPSIVFGDFCTLL